MEQSKTIVVIGGKNILHQSIEGILASRPEWKVVSITSLAELDGESENADNLHHELVFILEGCHDDRLALELFQEFPGSKVIQISLEDNLMDVYSIQKILFNQPSDLLKIIEYRAPRFFQL